MTAERPQTWPQPSVPRRWLWTIVAILIAWGLVVASRGRPPLPPPQEGGGNDLQMYSAVTARVAAGENYYRVLADELPRRGYAVRPILNWRLPTLTWLNTIPPVRVSSRVLLVALGLSVIVLWLMAIRRSVPRMALVSLPVLLVGTAPLLPMDASVVFYEVWAGLLIAASLACSGRGWWKWSLTLGAAALAIRELALPYALVMAVLAWRETRRREAIAWVGVVAAACALWAWHASQVLHVLPPTGLTNTWLVTGGWSFVMEAANASIFLMLLPERTGPYLAAFIVPVVWAGSWHWRDALGRRIALILTTYFGMFMMVGRPDNWYWGFVIAPLLQLGAFGYFFGPGPARRWRKRS